MALPELLKNNLRIPLIGARPQEKLEDWLLQIKEELAASTK